MTNQSKQMHFGGCPYWSAKSLKCLLCPQGLFIPLDDHIDVYCTTPDYPKCLQYVLHSADMAELAAQTVRHGDDQGMNRRQYPRMGSRHKVTLVKLMESGKIVSHFSTIGSTIDLSSGGMRLTTDEPLIDDTLLRFSFDESLPGEVQQGVGQVAWSNPERNDTGYLAGIQFTDDKLIRNMGIYLGMQYGLS